MKVFHVNGRQRASERSEIICKFRESDIALISNARCLTEGVDVPEIDMVAFLSPKRSKVDVIQATGRAMRKDRDGKKSVGYILVPIYLETESNEGLVDAMCESDFSEVFDVLNALQEQDEVLAESLCSMREKSEDIKGFIDERFEERISIEGPKLELSELKQAVTTKIVNRLTPIWYERFSELKKFFELNGHSNVPANWKDNTPLANWVRTQRNLYSLEQLSEDQLGKLKKLNFVWSLNETRWEERYFEYAEFVEEFGVLSIPNEDEYVSLRSWVMSQRKEQRNGTLAQDRFELLDELGVVWDIREERWNERYLELFELYETTGSTLVPRSSDFQSLYSWVKQQRTDHNLGVLSEERVQLLDDIEFSWRLTEAPSDDSWTSKYDLLKAYFETHGTSYVPARYPSIGSWSAFQREYRRKGELSDERIAKLDDINFVWEPRDKNWLAKYFEYKGLLKSSDSKAFTENQNARNLRSWMAAQKREIESYSSSDDILLQNRAKLLSDIQLSRRFVNYQDDDNFIEMLDRLSVFFDKFGHSRVPTKGGDYPQLGRWVDSIRKRFNKNNLENYEVELLEEYDFDFQPGNRKTYLAEKVFSERLSELTTFKEKNGHLNLPTRNGLGAWLGRQKTSYRKGILEQRKFEELEKLGVNFDIVMRPSSRLGGNAKSKEKRERIAGSQIQKNAMEAHWQSRFLELIKFKADHGHTNPTVTAGEQKSLAGWVKAQRSNARKEKLSLVHIQQLKSIDFEFIAPKQAAIKSWDRRFEDLVHYYDEYGHVNIPLDDKENASTKSWVGNQITKHRNGQLAPLLSEKLRGCGVVLEKQKSRPSWNEWYQELLMYKDAEGHADVPQLYGGTTGLGKWVNRQRQSYQRGKLSNEKIEKLELLGFIWGGARGRNLTGR